MHGGRRTDNHIKTMKTIIITGASDGIGAEAARQLHARGENVVIVGRSPERTKAIAEELGVNYYLADFSRLDTVRRLAADLRSDYDHIDILVNNAGGIFGKREISTDGHELTLQVNHLAPFLLTTLLMDKLVKSKASVINTASVANKVFSRFDIDDLENERRYTPESAYGNAKLENILFTKELHNRYQDKGISTAALHPGNVATSFAKSSTSPLRFLYGSFLKKLFLITPEKGADTIVWLCTTQPNKDWDSGSYYIKRKKSDQTHPAANDPTIAERLWDWSEKAVNVDN